MSYQQIKTSSLIKMQILSQKIMLLIKKVLLILCYLALEAFTYLHQGPDVWVHFQVHYQKILLKLCFYHFGKKGIIC